MTRLRLRLLACPFVALALLACSPASDHVKVSGPIKVAANTPFSLKTPVPLGAPNYFNWVCLLPESPKQLAQEQPFGFVTANGKEFSPNVTAKNADGVEDRFPEVAMVGDADGRWLCFAPSGTYKSLHPPFIEVTLLSPEPLSLKAIEWHSEDK